MPRLGPGEKPTNNSGAVPAGEYIIALRSFQRKHGKTSRKEYLSMRFVVCSGPLKGRTFFASMSLDLSVEGIRNRWIIWIEACDIKEEFELGSTREGTAQEGDENINRLFVGVPFKATIKTEINGQYTNNDIQLIHFRSKWTQADLAAMSVWLDEEEKRAAGRSDDGDAGGGGPVDDPGGGGGPVNDDDDYYQPGGGTKAGGYAGDDDIPF